MGMTVEGTDLFLDAMLEVSALPANLYLALTATQPQIGDDGTSIDEPTDAAYARQALGTGASYWSAASGGFSSFANAIEFPVATEDWDSMRYWVICSALTGGDIYIWGQFTDYFNITTGQKVTMTADSFGLTLSPQGETVVT